jgi:hypothetical protein
MDDFLKFLLGAIVVTAVAAVIILSWQTISNWFAVNKTSDVQYGKLIKESLSNGNFNLVGGVFNNAGELINNTRWENASLDADTLGKFGNSNTLIVTY